MRRPFWLAGLLAASVVLAGCGGSSDKAGGTPAAKSTQLTLADPLDDPNQLNAFVGAVSRLSKGSLQIVVRSGWRGGQATYATGTIRDVRAGKAELGAVGTGALAAVGVESFSALDAPFLIDSYALEDRVVRSPLIFEMLKGLRPLGLVGVGVLPGPLRRPLGFAHALLSPADYRGVRVGVQPSPVASETMRALGATPVQVSIAQSDVGSLKGLGGLERHLDDVLNNGYDRDGAYLTGNVVFWPRPVVVFANARSFARLAPDQQRVLEQALSESIAPEQRYQNSYEAISQQLLCDGRHLRFVTADASVLAALHRSVRSVYAALGGDPQTRRFITQIAAMRARLGRSTDSVPPCRVAPPLSDEDTVPSPVDGVYALDVAPGLLPLPERVGEQYGSWQLVFDRGTFRLTQQSTTADWNADGLVRVNGAQMIWTVRDALDWGTHGAPDGVPIAPNQTLRFRWRLSGRALVLSSEDEAPLLPALGVRALTRVGDAPGQQQQVNPAVLQGTWVANVTRADALAHHQDPEGIPANIGSLRLTVRGRRCRFDQHAPAGYSWFAGTCRFAGDTLEFDQTPNENNGAFPMFWHWSVYHGRLSFRDAPGFSIDIFSYHPWRKVAS